MMNWRDLSKDEQIAALQNVACARHIWSSVRSFKVAICDLEQ